MDGAALAGADAEIVAGAELGQHVARDRVVAAVVAELDEAVGAVGGEVVTECRDAGKDGGVGRLGVGELHVAGEQQVLAGVGEGRDDALEVDQVALPLLGEDVQSAADQATVGADQVADGVLVDGEAGRLRGRLRRPVELLGQHQQVIAGRPDDAQADRGQRAEQLIGCIPAVADDVGPTRGEGGQHALVRGLEVGDGGQKLGHVGVGGAGAERLLAQRGDELAGGRGDRGVGRGVVQRAAPAEAGVGHERPVGAQQVLVDQRWQATDVVGVGVGDEQQVDVVGSGSGQELAQLVGDGGVAAVGGTGAGVAAVDQDGAVVELDQEGIAVLVDSDVEEVDPDRPRLRLRHRLAAIEQSAAGPGAALPAQPLRAATARAASTARGCARRGERGVLCSRGSEDGRGGDFAAAALRGRGGARGAGAVRRHRRTAGALDQPAGRTADRQRAG